MKKKMYMPMPANLNMWWNFGSLIATCLIMQNISGILLSMNYCPNTTNAFNSIIFITQETFMGWMLRNIHINSASLFFLFMFIHIMRGIYHLSFKLILTWMSGTIIFILSMMTAFLGYILPWGQMSFWGATVITNLISVLPYIGYMCIEWMWGNYSVGNSTLNRFYSLHFIFPIILMILIMIHLLTLHLSGSSNPLGSTSKIAMIPFHPYYTYKDLMGMMPLILMIMLISCQYPDLLIDPDNFTIANPLTTPTHIKPEWYFLFAYAILRSIPSKLGGIICLTMSVSILFIMPILNKPKMKSMKFYPFSTSMFWMFVNTTIMLTWLGMKPLNYPYIQMSQMFAFHYFSFFLSLNLISIKWDKI